MIKAVLLDLDDTLVHNPTAAFLQAYLSLANDYFKSLWGVDSISDLLRDAVKKIMFEPRNMHQSNLSIVLNKLVEATGHPPADIYSALHKFYVEEYPTISSCTRPVDSAPQIIERLKEKGYAVVIATNPIYPAEAIYKRLQWGNLPYDPAEYAFVTTADNMHFAKPSPEYYAEILARVGIEPDEAIMVGNDINNDIIPAAVTGLLTRHIESSHLHEFLPEIDRLDDLAPLMIKPEMMIPQLRGNVGALFGLIDNVKPNFWNQHPDPNEWSPMQIVCHLLEKENEAQRPNIAHILHEENYFVADKMPLGADAPPCGDDGYEIAMKFLHSRKSTVEIIKTITPDQWDRRARHSVFGPTNLLEIVHFTAQHDRLHLNQLCQTIGNCE